MNNKIGFFVVPAATVNGRVFERRDGAWQLTAATLEKIVREYLADAPDHMSDEEATRNAVDEGIRIQAETAPELEREWQKFWQKNAVGMTEYASR